VELRDRMIVSISKGKLEALIKGKEPMEHSCAKARSTGVFLVTYLVDLHLHSHLHR
jgi:uncharacterized protein with NRDE domain